MDKITIGRVVYYTLTPDDVERITVRRTNNSCLEGNPVVPGQQVAMEVTLVNVEDQTVNGQCTLDGNDAHWVGHVPQRFVGDKPMGRWFWPRIERPEPKSENPNPPQQKAQDAAVPQRSDSKSELPGSGNVLPLHNRKSEEKTAVERHDKADDTIVIPRTADELMDGVGAAFTFPPGEGPQPGDSTAGDQANQTMPTDQPTTAATGAPPVTPRKTKAEKKAEKAAERAAKKAKK